ncbi:MAG: PspC domain-containing protein [Candidatus Pacebacteria bacterium]|nr:PspC domain-containing protein [Candidatus Paceibacterota bacterium]
MAKTKKLYRSSKNRVLFGVCGGLGEYFNLDAVIFRLLFVALLFGGGSGLVIYILFAIIIPPEEEAKK